MKEFFLNHTCTTPPFTVASCEYQYLVCTFVGIATLIGSVVMVVIALARRQKDDRPRLR